MTTSRTGWTEVGDRVYSRRYEPVDITVTAIVGPAGVAVVDTRCSLAEGRELRDDLRTLSPAPVRWVVNTHAHWDHCWGNAEFVTPRQNPSAEIWGHRTVPDAFRSPWAAELKKEIAADSDEWAAKVAELVEVPPTHLVDTAHTLDIGDRSVAFRHVGRGHTDGDLLILVPDANLVLGGDLIEESGPVGYGPDSFPLEWPATLDRALALADDDTVFVPGHGDPVDTRFVREQRATIAAVAAEIHRMHAAGVAPDRALDAGAWPYPWPYPAYPAHLVARGYAALDGLDGTVGA
jgi:glyoxylase-like metal-dependent hydrolase (beta-lactamase superfamily II)